MATKEKPIIISYMTLRKAIGWLGILLPFALLIGNCLVSLFTNYELGCSPFKASISDFYYTRMGDLFVGVMCAVALFLFCYKGKETIDNKLTNAAGFFALGVVIFPTSSKQEILCNTRCYISEPLVGNFHLISAALFFITLAVISYSIFTRTTSEKTFFFLNRKGEMTSSKKKRNRIYKICGLVMIACLVGIVIYKWLSKESTHPDNNLHVIFWFETIALIAFGISWLTKGEFILKDKK